MQAFCQWLSWDSLVAFSELWDDLIKKEFVGVKFAFVFLIWVVNMVLIGPVLSPSL